VNIISVHTAAFTVQHEWKGVSLCQTV